MLTKTKSSSSENPVCIRHSIRVRAKWSDKGPTFSSDTGITEKEVHSIINEHGTAVTFHWDSKIEPKDFPSKKAIIDSLTQYYELKTALNDDEIDIVLVYLDGKESPEPKKLEFVNHDKNAKELGTKTDIQLDVDPNYDIRIISAKVFRSINPLNQEKGEARTGGLFIEGEHGQIFDLTLL